ncbi:MAG TPA: right-handed parallel beta-helix repeat-containing protein [Verrucomicrobiae bacterium]|nr:right-handed parallel beta-helix repeat-containing protein [Verrucomicrobiae bacterium]
MLNPAPRFTQRFVLSASLSLLITFGGSLIASPFKIYLAPDGNDQWTGRFDRRTADGQDGPLATLPAALQQARQIRQTVQTSEGVLILARGGTYTLREPMTIGPADSGAGPLQTTTVAAYPGERPVFSGGRAITGWHPAADMPGVWETDLPEVRAGHWYFRSLFVNGQRARRARTPNEGFFRVEGASPAGKSATFRYRDADIKPAWAGSEAEVVTLVAWMNTRMFIHAVDGATRTVTLSSQSHPDIRENDCRYYIENAPDSLDAPGEWQLDRKTGRLRYWPRPGEDLAKTTVIAPVLKDLVRLQGDLAAKRPVRFVTLRGLTFADTDWDLAPDGYADTQAAINIHGDLFAEATIDCVIEDCTFTRLGGYAIELGKGCQRDRVSGNELVDIGAGGIRIGETAQRLDPFEQNHTHIFSDNHAHRLGRVYPPAVGVLVLQSGTNWIAHNHIHDLYYTAVSVGWNWGYQETPCRENIVEFNHLHDIGQAMLSDMGAVYTLGIQHGTIIRNNLIHDVDSFTYGGWGIYPDEGSTGIVWEKNIIYRTKSAGFHQHYGRENVVRNNILAFGREYQLMRTREEDHTSFFFTNNIVYFDSGNLLGSNWKNEHFVIDHNLYFDTRPAATADSMKFGGATWEAWRQRGHDTNSIIADPLFVAPEKHDFRLRPGSPALKMGFKPIDISNVGVRRPKEPGSE